MRSKNILRIVFLLCLLMCIGCKEGENENYKTSELEGTNEFEVNISEKKPILDVGLLDEENSVKNECGNTIEEESKLETNVSEEDLISDVGTLDEENSVKNEYGNTIGNIVSGGWLAKQGEWIYYNNDKGLYRIKENGTERTHLDLDDASYINVVGEWVYYSYGGIKKVKCNGEKDTYIIPEDPTQTEYEIEYILDGPVGNQLYICGDWIYYTTQREGKDDREYYLHKINVDGTGKQMLCDITAHSINVVGDWVYFVYGKNRNTEDKGIYKVKIDGTQLQKISSEYTEQITVIEEYIYFYCSFLYNPEEGFTEGAGIYRIKTDGTGRELLFKVPEEERMFYTFSDNIFVSKDYIFFYKVGYNDFGEFLTWYKMKTDGTELQEVEVLMATQRVGNRVKVAIFDDYIYFKIDDAIYQMKADGTGQLRLE